MRQLILSLLALTGLCAAAGCTYYSALTPPPPGRVADLDTEARTIVISRGVALGFRCISAWGDPCSKEGQATLDDPKVAQVYPAYLNRLEPHAWGSFTPTSYVVVGLTAGQTVLRIPDQDPITITVKE